MARLTLYHFQQDVETIDDFINKNHINGINASDLFDQNREAIFNQLSPDQKAELSKEAGKEITKEDLNYTMTLPKPCILSIEDKYVERELTISQTNFQESSDDIYAFENSYIQSILQNDGYKIDTSTKKKCVRCDVWGWFKSLNTIKGDETDKFNNPNRKKIFTNISDYVISVDTNVNENGGTFSITLPIVSTTEYMKKHITIGWHDSKFDHIEQNTLRFKEVNNIVINNESIYHKGGMSGSSCDNYFNWLIQSNDLIFISFERLEIEEEGTVFDMIGLVENVTVNMEADGSGRVTISGRDLMKLITDDNSLFFNLSTVWGENQVFANGDNIGDMKSIDTIGGNYNPLDRIRRSTNEIDIFATPFNKTISFIIKGVVSQLANIRVVPDYVFDSWGTDRTEFSHFEYENDASNNTSIDTESEININKEFER